jgi:hypothetical protein
MKRVGAGGMCDGSGVNSRIRQSNSDMKDRLEGLKRVLAVCVCVHVCMWSVVCGGCVCMRARIDFR